MSIFSSRYGYKHSTLQIESVSQTLIQRVYNEFCIKEITHNYTTYIGTLTSVERMVCDLGLRYNQAHKDYVQINLDKIEEYLFSSEWYAVYDFIEKYLAICSEHDAIRMEETFNKILIEEVAGYRILNKQVVPITNDGELEEIRKASTTPFSSVNHHLIKALNLYADRRMPDYENSVKESISAVEAMCCIITGMTGANATLGAALKKLKDKGIHIHKAMENAFSSLYGYASNENGIRHGGIDFTDVPAEDAKYMLVSCSAFVNYLIEKWSKAGNS